MIPAKPIEPGCMALIVHMPTPENGRIVKVGEKVEPSFHTRQVNIWEVDIFISWRAFGKRGKFLNETKMLRLCPEKFLLRIDDPDNQSLIESQENIVRKEDAIYRCPM